MKPHAHYVLSHLVLQHDSKSVSFRNHLPELDSSMMHRRAVLDELEKQLTQARSVLSASTNLRRDDPKGFRMLSERIERISALIKKKK